MKNFLRIIFRLINRFFNLFNMRLVRGSRTHWTNGESSEIFHSRILPFATYSPWLSDENFIACYSSVQNNTLVDIFRCYELWSLVKQTANVPGDILEVGVWRGGTGCLLAKAAEHQGKKVFLADTFTGVVKAGGKDTSYVGGEHNDTSLSIVHALEEGMGLRNITILQGMFPEDTAENIHGNISLLHCDVDVYLSAKDIIDWGKDRLSRGGVIVFDDYGFSGCEGVTRLVNELRESDEWLFLHNLNGHGILVKR